MILTGDDWDNYTITRNIKIGAEECYFDNWILETGRSCGIYCLIVWKYEKKMEKIENSRLFVREMLEAIGWFLELLLRDYMKREEDKVYLLDDKRKASCWKLENKVIYIFLKIRK